MDYNDIPTLEDELDLAIHNLASQADHVHTLLAKLSQRGAP